MLRITFAWTLVELCNPNYACIWYSEETKIEAFDATFTLNEETGPTGDDKK